MPRTADLSARSAGGTAAGTPSAPQRALQRLGLVEDIDLALHLALRYEDETRVTPIAALHNGQSAQIEGTVTHSEISFRPRRQLLVTLDDGTDSCTLRFFTFYPAHQKLRE